MKKSWESIIMHSYLTDGFFNWGKILLTSFKHYHGDEIPFYLTTRDLNAKQIEELKNIYLNLHIDNAPLDFNKMSRLSGISAIELKRFKNQIETDHVTNNGNVIWKQFISVEDRYRNSIIDTMRKVKNGKFMVHIDADMYIRGDMTILFNLIKRNDISIKFRLDRKLNRKVLGNLIGFRICKKTYRFMKVWINHINAINIKNKPKGYGQSSFYLAYNDLKDKNYKWGDIPSKFANPRMREDCVIWSGNHSRGKTKNLVICLEDLKNEKE